ncbi:MAG: DUF4296 domain-containing protein [Alistipes sp.]|nr:DUF4296 domain-containing protein [Alistipes sp.]
MKRLLICALAVLSIFGCARRKEIDDKTLAIIFRDAYLTNAYLGVNYINLDSILIYEPILDRYGYTAEDFRYTIGNFSRRKSAQLGRVLKDAESQISDIATIYEKKVVILDTIRNVAIRSFKRTIRRDSLIEIKTKADTSKLRLEIAPLQPGSYSVRYKYNYEKPAKKKSKKKRKSTIENEVILRGAMYVETNSGTQRNNYSYALRDEENIRRTITTDTSAYKLIINFAKPSDELQKLGTPKLKISNLEITYTPDADLAIDSLFKRHIDIKIFDDVFFNNQKDSLALSADTTRVL